MNQIATWLLVVAVLLAGAVGPGLALQGGPPDHANDDGDGPPDHANAGDDDDDSDGDEQERDDDERDGEDRNEDRDDDGVLSVVEDTVDDDEDDATPTASDRPTSTESDDSETPTNPVEPVLQILETPEDTPEETPESNPEETPESNPEETPEETDGPSSQEQDPLPDPRATETPTPTQEPTETPQQTREETPEPTATPSAGGGNSDDGADGSGGSTVGSDADPTSTPTPSEPSIQYDNGDDLTRASVEDVRAGQTVEVPLRGPATDGEDVAVEAIDVGLESGEPFTLTVTRPTADGGEEPAPGVPVGYFDVETDHGAVGNATLTVSVDESALPAGVAPEDLEVLRYADGEWQSTETTYDEAAGVYTAETAGFSQFALAAPGDGPLQVTDVAVEESGEDGSGEEGPATVHATVENTVDRQATGTVAITVDGETVGTRELSLGGGETATVSFDLPAEQAEDGTVAVDGVESERLQVQETETETAAGSIDGNLAFGIGAAAFLVISAVGTGLLAARSDELAWER